VPCCANEGRQAQSLAVTSEPCRIERLNAPDRIDRPREVGIPAPDDKIDLGIRSQRLQVGNGRKHHQQIPNPFEAQQKDPAWCGWGTAVAEGPHDSSSQCEDAVGGRHERALAAIVNMQAGHSGSSYFTATRSTITPTSRSSGVPSTFRGLHVGVTSFSSTGSAVPAAMAARSGGMANL
jgi:hypothetical protein